MTSAPTIPWLTEKELAAWRALLRSHGLVSNKLDEELAAEAGITLADYEVLVFLSEAPERRLRMSELANSVLLSRSGLTRRIDGLVQRGWVDRQPCPGDRRAVHAVLTDAGLERLREVAPIHLRGVREHVISHLTAEDLEAMARILTKIADPLAGGRGDCPGPGTAC